MSQPNAVAVFIHGFISGPHTWSSVVAGIEASNDMSEDFDLKLYKYDTRLTGWRPDRRIPDIPTIAEDLKSYLDIECGAYSSIVLIGHSMGGLIIQQFLAQKLWDNSGNDLARIRRVVLLACPTNGSQFLLSIRKRVRFLSNVQERMLRPHSDVVTRAHKKVMQHVVFATEMSEGSCPIPVIAYAGSSDNVVPLATAQSDFPGAKALPGDHFSILDASKNGGRIVTAIRYELAAARLGRGPAPDGALSNGYQVEADAASGDRKLLSVDPLRPLIRLHDNGRISDIYDRSLAREYLRKGTEDGSS